MLPADLALPLLASPAWLDRPAVVDAQRSWTWRQVHAASLALSQRLGEADAVCNLCASRAGFLITCLAAWRRRCLMILPPSSSAADLAAVLASAGRPVVVGDPPVWPEPGCDVGFAPSAYLSCSPAWAAPSASAESLAWQPAWDEVAVVLYTSGSTGAPEAQPKTLGHLLQGARVLADRLDREVEGGAAAIGRIVCSVPPQHMFGLECSVMLPLACGMPVLEGRPLLPADVRDAFDGCLAGAWIATPMHLRSLAHSVQAVPACRAVIASTMPLAPGIARQAEVLVQAPVLEIYGSTETGALAMRRTARESRWQPMAGVRLEPGERCTLGHGSHFASPVELLDELVLDGDGAFTLVGRQGDLVKIAGRRASLTGLNLLLQDLPGLEDGVFYLPDTGNPTERLCLVHSGPPLDPTAVRDWLRQRLDAVFLPRTFIRLERMPRSDNGKLRRQMLELAVSEWRAAQGEARPHTVGVPVGQQAECS